MNNIRNFFVRYRQILLVMCLPFALASCGEGKCGIPGDPYFYQCFYYYTDDMTETKVVFNKGVNTTKSFTFSIPKAFIIFASGYAESETSVLPDQISVSNLEFLLTYPSGLPLKVARNKNQNENYYGVGVTANYSGYDGLYGPDCGGKDGKAMKFVALVGGYRQFENLRTCPNNPEYLLDDASIGRSIKCSSQDDKVRVGQLCRHKVRLRDGIEAEIVLPDFRANGGLLVTEQKAAFFLRTLCPMIGCDPKYTDYFYNLESK